MSEPSRAPFDFVADQAEVDAQAGLFGVYLSAIDFNDNFYTLMDSITAYRQHDFHYDEGLGLIAKFPDYDSANAVSEDLHQVVLRGLSVMDFQKRHDLQISANVRKQIQQYQSATDFSIFDYAEEFKMVLWCREAGLDLDCLRFDEEEYDEEEEEVEIQFEIVAELIEKKEYDRLDQLRAALKIGKFAFVHPTSEA